MSEKCFCHLNGYAVKDAKARKDIEILKRVAEGEIYSFHTDSNGAYEKGVPENALPYATIDKIGGLAKNFDKVHVLKPNGSYKASSGLTFSYLGSFNEITLNGTIKEGMFLEFDLEDKFYNLMEASNKYTTLNIAYKSGSSNGETSTRFVKIFLVTIDGEKIDIGNYPLGTSNISRLLYFPKDKCVKAIRIEGNTGEVTLSKYRFCLYGTYTADNYPIAKPTAIKMKMKSANIIDPYLMFNDGVFYTFNDNEIINNRVDTRAWVDIGGIDLESGTYTIYCNHNIAFYLNSNYKSVEAGNPFTFTVDGVTTLKIKISGVTSFPSTVNISLNIGENVIDSSFYGEKVLIDIPQEVKDIEGYGLTMSEEIYNYIDFDSLNFVKMCTLVDGVFYQLAEPIHIDISSFIRSGDIEVEPGATIIFENENKADLINSVSYNLKL